MSQYTNVTVKYKGEDVIRDATAKDGGEAAQYIDVTGGRPEEPYLEKERIYSLSGDPTLGTNGQYVGISEGVYRFKNVE